MNGRSDPRRRRGTRWDRWGTAFGLNWTLAWTLSVVLSFTLGACSAVDSLLRNDPAEPQDRASRFDRFSRELLLGLRDTAPVLERIRLAGGAEDLAGMPWDQGRRRIARQSLLWNALARVTTEFPASRFQGRRAAEARIIVHDLRRALGMEDEAPLVGRMAPEPPPAPGVVEALSATPWEGILVQSPSVLLREHPASNPADVAAWTASLNALTEEVPAIDEPAAAVASREFYGRPPFLLALVIEDVMRLKASAGAGGPQDPWFGPLAEATRSVPGSGSADAFLTPTAKRRLQREVQTLVDDSADVLDELRSRITRGGSLALDADVRDESLVLPPRGDDTGQDQALADTPWMRDLRDAAGRAVDPSSLDDLARFEIDRLTRTLGGVLELNPGTGDLIAATRTRLAEIRERDAEPPGATEPLRSPETLWEAIEPRLAELVSEPPPIALEAHLARSFERPHGRWSPFVRGNLTGVRDPRARPSVFLRARERDPISPGWICEAEALRYGIPGRGLGDAFRRAARLDTSPYLLLAQEREAFEEGWGLYAVQEAADLGVLLETDRGFGRIAQELVAMTALSADIGVHSSGWTREQAIEFVLESTPLPGSAARDLVARIFSHPGRAGLPAIGLLRMRNLRRYFESFLGPDFSAPEFHSALLRGGPIPMGELDARLEVWLNERGADDE